MTDQEAMETWAALSAVLTRFNLEDILRRVEAYIREGKPEEREIEQLEERPGGEGRLFQTEDVRRRPGRRSRYLAVIEYTPQERVQILADAILHAVVFSRQMEHEIWNYLEKLSGDPKDIVNVRIIRVAREIQGGEPVVTALRRQAPLVELGKLQQALQQISHEAQK